MSHERQRLFQQSKRNELRLAQIAWHRGSYRAFLKRIRRRAAKQSAKGRAGIRHDAAHFMDWIADERTLRVAWDHLAQHGGQAPGIDGWRYCDFPDNQIWDSLRDLRNTIREGRYEPAEDRIINISKGPGRGTRPLSLPCIHDRVVQRGIVEILQPYLDPLFDPHSFAYRPQRGVLQAVAHAEHYVRTEGRTVWVTSDLRDAFGHVPVERLLQVVQHYVPAEDVVAFIRTVLAGAQKPGLRQGSPLSPLLLNLYLDHVLDRKWRLLHPEIPLLRYADDILLMCRSKAEAQQAHDDLVELLRPTGMQVKGDRRSDVVTLTPATPALWLGFRFEKRGTKSLRTLIADKAWESLAQNLDEAHDAPNSPVQAIHAMKGWVGDKGPCFQHTDLNAAWEQLAGIAQSVGYDEIPDRHLLKEWWQRAHARWCKLRKSPNSMIST